MNRGSALKWPDAVETGDHVLNDGGGLHYFDGSMCLIGILEDIVTGNWEEGFFSFETQDGSSYAVSDHTVEKCKIKTNLDEAAGFFADNYDQPRPILAAWIRDNYTRL